MPDRAADSTAPNPNPNDALVFSGDFAGSGHAGLLWQNAATGQVYGLSSADGTFSWGTNGTLTLQQNASGYWRPIASSGIT